MSGIALTHQGFDEWHRQRRQIGGHEMHNEMLMHRCCHITDILGVCRRIVECGGDGYDP